MIKVNLRLFYRRKYDEDEYPINQDDPLVQAALNSSKDLKQPEVANVQTTPTGGSPSSVMHYASTGKEGEGRASDNINPNNVPSQEDKEDPPELVYEKKTPTGGSPTNRLFGFSGKEDDDDGDDELYDYIQSKNSSSGSGGSGTGSGTGTEEVTPSVDQQYLDYLIQQYLSGDYSSYKDQFRPQYEYNARKAMENTMAELAARTGGLASSYAGAVGQSVYNDYMNQLETAARDAYQTDRSNQYNDISFLKSLLDEQEADAENAELEAENDAATAKAEAKARLLENLSLGMSLDEIDDETKTLSGLTEAELAAYYNAYNPAEVESTADLETLFSKAVSSDDGAEDYIRDNAEHYGVSEDEMDTILSEYQKWLNSEEGGVDRTRNATIVNTEKPLNKSDAAMASRIIGLPNTVVEKIADSKYVYYIEGAPNDGWLTMPEIEYYLGDESGRKLDADYDEQNNTFTYTWVG